MQPFWRQHNVWPAHRAWSGGDPGSPSGACWGALRKTRVLHCAGSRTAPCRTPDSRRSRCHRDSGTTSKVARNTWSSATPPLRQNRNASGAAPRGDLNREAEDREDPTAHDPQTPDRDRTPHPTGHVLVTAVAGTPGAYPPAAADPRHHDPSPKPRAAPRSRRQSRWRLRR